MKISCCDWWQPQRSASDVKHVDYSEFITAAKAQLDKYETTFGGMEGMEHMEISQVETVLGEKRFQEMAKVAEELDQGIMPIMTYHGTRSPSTINSITKHGYVLPGDLHPGSGQVMGMTHGNYLGDGVYTSTFFDVSSRYADLDRHKCIQLLVNLTVIGRPFVIGGSKQVVHAFGQMFDWKNVVEHPGPSWDHKHKRWWYPWVDPQITAPIGGVFCLGGQEYHTRLTGDLRAIVSGSGKYVFPIFVITVTPKTDYQVCREYSLWKGNHMAELRKFTHRDDPKLPFLSLHRITGDLYSIRVSPTASAGNDLHHHFVYPNLRDAQLERLTANFIDSQAGSKSLWVWDDGPQMFRITTAASFVNRVHRVPGRAKILPTLEGVLHFVAKGSPTVTNVVYVYIKGSQDGKTIDRMVEEWGRHMAVKRVLVKLIYIGAPCRACYRLKTHLQTLWPFEEYLHSVENGVAELYDRLGDENDGIAALDHRFSIPYPHGVCGEGFVTGLEKLPEFDCLWTGSVLYKGEFTEYIVVNDQAYKTRLEDDIDVETASRALVTLISKFRCYLMVDPSRYHEFESVITLLCSGTMERLDQTKKAIRAAQGGLDAPLSKPYVERMRAIRTFFCRMSALFTEMNTFCRVSFRGKWFERVVAMKYGKQLVKRAATPVDLAAVSAEVGVKVRTAEDALTCSKLQGLGIRTSITGASEVEPWLLQIDHISLDTFLASDLFNAVETQDVMLDSAGQAVTDCLIDSRSEVGKLYYAYIYTRNPHLFLGSQRFSLPVIALVNCVEMVFMYLRTHKPQEADHSYLRRMMDLAFRLVGQVRDRVAHDADLAAVVDAILSHDDFEQYLTEARGIASVCRLLGGLAAPSAARAFASTKYSRLAFALMAESVMRSCRGYLKGTGKDSNRHIRSVLRIDDATDLDAYVFDLERGARRTGRFYTGRFTNCSPFALVATLEFLERVHEGYDAERVLAAFVDGSVSMRNFLARHLPGFSGQETQVALFLQGMKYNKSRFRQDVRFRDPGGIIREMIDEQKEILQRKREMIELMKVPPAAQAPAIART